MQFIASYSRLQDNIRWLYSYWTSNNPVSAPLVTLNQRYGSIFDADHPVIVLEVARLTHSSAKLQNFTSAYMKAKSHRDFVCHAMFLNPMQHRGEMSFGMPHYHGDSRVRRLDGGQRGAARITDATLARRELEIAWMLEQVQWIMREAGWRGGPGSVPDPESRPPAAPRRH